jgi:hypothetical protein
VSVLRKELARVGITGRLARRIELELADHMASDPHAELGEPRLIAERFAEELRLPKTRRAVHAGFGALALTACGLAALAGLPGAKLGAAPGPYDAFAGLGIVLGAQVAFVTGTLALWGVHHGAQLRLVQRRLLVALGAGTLVLAGESVDAAVGHPAVWWYAIALAALLVPAAALARTGFELREAVAVTPAGVAPAASFTRPAVVAIGAAAALAVTVGSAVAEHSWTEGVIRGVFEVVAFTGCFLAFGRSLGIRR